MVSISVVWALWMGNMLTDINQGTAFFDAVSGTRPNPYDTGRCTKQPKLEEVRGSGPI